MFECDGKATECWSVTRTGKVQCACDGSPFHPPPIPGPSAAVRRIRRRALAARISLWHTPRAPTETGRIAARLTVWAAVAPAVERALGKGEVGGSNPPCSTTFPAVRPPGLPDPCAPERIGGAAACAPRPMRASVTAWSELEAHYILPVST